MVVFIFHSPCLLTTKLSCLQKNKSGYAIVSGEMGDELFNLLQELALQPWAAHAPGFQVCQQEPSVLMVIRRTLEDNSRHDAPDRVLEPGRSVAEHIRGAKVAELHCLQGAEDHHCVTKYGDRVDVTELLGKVWVIHERGVTDLMDIAYERQLPWAWGQAGPLGQLEDEEKNEKAKDDFDWEHCQSLEWDHLKVHNKVHATVGANRGLVRRLMYLL